MLLPYCRRVLDKPQESNLRFPLMQVWVYELAMESVIETSVPVKMGDEVLVVADANCEAESLRFSMVVRSGGVSNNSKGDISPHTAA